MILDILNLATVILSLLFFNAFRQVQYKLYDKIDATKQTQDDYSLFITDIPVLDFESG